MNCSVKEIIARINRIHLQNDILNETNFLFPKLNVRKFINRVQYELPDELQIFEQIETSKHKAIEDAIEIGSIYSNSADRISFASKITPIPMKAKKVSGKIKENISISSTLLRREAIVLKNFAEKFEDEVVPEKSCYVEVFRSNKKRNSH